MAHLEHRSIRQGTLGRGAAALLLATAGIATAQSADSLYLGSKTT